MQETRRLPIRDGAYTSVWYKLSHSYLCKGHDKELTILVNKVFSFYSLSCKILYVWINAKTNVTHLHCSIFRRLSLRPTQEELEQRNILHSKFSRTLVIFTDIFFFSIIFFFTIFVFAFSSEYWPSWKGQRGKEKIPHKEG